MLVWRMCTGCCLLFTDDWIKRPPSRPLRTPRAEPTSHTYTFAITHTRAAARPLHLFLRPHTLSRLYRPAGSTAGGADGNKAMLHVLENGVLLFSTDSNGFSLRKEYVFSLSTCSENVSKRARITLNCSSVPVGCSADDRACRVIMLWPCSMALGGCKHFGCPYISHPNSLSDQYVSCPNASTSPFSTNNTLATLTSRCLLYAFHLYLKKPGDTFLRCIMQEVKHFWFQDNLSKFLNLFPVG